MPGERNSVEPMAAVVSAACVSVQHQLLLRFVGPAPWSDEAVLSKVRGLALPAIEDPGPIEAWIVDDTRFIRRDVHSVSRSRRLRSQVRRNQSSLRGWQDRQGDRERIGPWAKTCGTLGALHCLAGTQRQSKDWAER
jgi:hypothetical protein